VNGEWNENGAALIPRGAITWHDFTSKRSAVGTIDGVVVARIRFVRHALYQMRVEGWQWRVTDDMPLNRFNSIPGNKVLFTPVKSFTSMSSAKKEAVVILGRTFFQQQEPQREQPSNP
jgi:hypothetical protein